MRSRLLVATALGVALALAPVDAQWPRFPDKNLPLKADGTPNLDAPTPRTADGKPDLSGRVAERVVLRRAGGKAAGGEAGRAAALHLREHRHQLPQGAAAPAVGRQALLAERKEWNSKDNPDAFCLPMGIMQFHEHPQPRKIIQTPDVIVILYEGNAGVRQIFTDGRRAADERSAAVVVSATRWAAGRATRWWCGPTASATAAGSTSTARR